MSKEEAKADDYGWRHYGAAAIALGALASSIASSYI